MKTTHCSRAIITSLLVRGIAIFAVCALGLPTAVLAKAKKTPFTGTETMTGQDVGTQFTDGTNAFLTGTRLYALEEMSDPRVSWHSTIGFNAIIDLASFSGPQWGSFHLENAGGAWDGYWQGTISSSEGGITDSIMVTAMGSRGYHGLVARWTYAGVGFGQGNPLEATGYIVEAKGAPSDRPLKVSGLRVDQLQLIPGMLLDQNLQPIWAGLIGRVDIVKGMGEASHLGRCTEQGLGLWDPSTGVVSATGTETAANGELLYWVATGTTELSRDGKTAVFNSAVHFAGGTGRFEAAVGGFSGKFKEHMEPTKDPMVSLTKYAYSARGTIRYFPCREEDGDEGAH